MDYGSVITLWRYAIIHPIYTRDTFRGEFPLHVTTRAVNSPSRNYRSPPRTFSLLRAPIALAQCPQFSIIAIHTSYMK